MRNALTVPMSIIACSAAMTLLALGGCWAQASDDLSCSSAAATETVQKLVRDVSAQGANAMQSEFIDFDRTAIVVEAIRTIRSTPKSKHCQASVRINVAFKTDKNGQFIGSIFQGHTETAREMRYQVQLTDDGKIYVTLDPDEGGNGVGAPSGEDDE